MYDVFLIERPLDTGLTKAEIMDMFDSLKENEAFPIEIFNLGGESSAMGFITQSAAEKIDYDYEKSGLNQFVGEILADMNLETSDGIYDFKELHIFIGR